MMEREGAGAGRTCEVLFNKPTGGTATALPSAPARSLPGAAVIARWGAPTTGSPRPAEVNDCSLATSTCVFVCLDCCFLSVVFYFWGLCYCVLCCCCAFCSCLCVRIRAGTALSPWLFSAPLRVYRRYITDHFSVSRLRRAPSRWFSSWGWLFV